MNGDLIIEQRKAVPVFICGIQLFCDSFSVSDTKVIAERATVSGGNAVTNIHPKCSRVVLKGRTFNETTPIEPVCVLKGFMDNSQTFNFFYRGISCKKCRVAAFTVEDSGRNYLDFSLTLAVEEFQSVGGGYSGSLCKYNGFCRKLCKGREIARFYFQEGCLCSVYDVQMQHSSRSSKLFRYC